MVKVYDKKINKSTDWGGDESTSGLPVAGNRVQEFIKEELLGKYGAMEIDDSMGDSNYLCCFASEEDSQKYFSDPVKYSSLLLNKILLPAGGGSSSSAQMRVSISDSPASKILKGSACVFAFTYYSYYGTMDDPSTTAGKLSVMINGSKIGKLAATLQHGESYSIDLAPYLDATNAVIITIDNGEGLTRNYRYSVDVEDIVLELLEYDQSQIRTGAFDVSVKVSGANAVVHLLVDGAEENTMSIVSGARGTFTIPAQNSHGLHTFALYAVSEDGSFETPQHLYKFIAALTSETVIASSFISTTAELYSNLPIEYWFYYKAGSIVEVDFAVINGDGETVYNSSEEISVTNYSSGTCVWNLNLGKSDFLGDIILKISVAGKTLDIPLTVTAGSFELTQASEWKMLLTSANRSNAQIDKNVWKYNDFQGNETPVVFNDSFAFKNTESGFNLDGDGNTTCHIQSGDSVTVPYKLFAQNFGQGGTKAGWAFEVEFATLNCVNMNAKVLSCVHGGVGVEIYANKAVFSSSGGSIETDFKENTRNRFSFVVECSNDSDRLFMSISHNGVPVRTRIYKASETFKQDVAQDIVIGSDDCDVNLYNMRAYNKSLTMIEVLNNYAYDTPNVEEKFAVAKRNDIFDASGNVSYAKLRKARPDLPVMILDVDKLPNVKKEDRYTVNSSSFENEDAGKDYAQPFTEEASILEPQGTSSSKIDASSPNGDYKYRNYNHTYKEFVLSDGTKSEKYSLYSGEEGENVFCTKKDFYSSEQYNNVILSSIYNDVCVSCGILSDPQREQQESGHEITYRTTIYGIPIVIFWKKFDGSLEYVGMFNLNNDKKNYKILGMDREKYPACEMWEVSDNVTFFDHPFSEVREENGKIVNDVISELEAVYPPKSPVNGTDYGVAENAGQIAVANQETAGLRRLANWLYATNRRCATGNALGNPYMDKDGKTHTIDNEDYRLAKFKTECGDYLNMGFMKAYYLHTARNLMIDSRSKNLHVFTFDGVHWCARVYDADTGWLINNNGELKNKFYYEDIDLDSSGAWVFNGQQVSLWENIRDGFFTELKELDRQMRTSSAGYNFTDLNARVNRHRDKWCEALYAYSDKVQYRNNPAYIDAGLGNKKAQLDFALYYLFRYWDSYYNTGDSANNSLTMRLWGTNTKTDLKLKYYCQLYSNVQWGSANVNTRIRCLDVENGCTHVNPTSAESLANFIIYMFSSDLITDLGDLSLFGDLSIDDFGSAPLLRKLKIGSDRAGFSNLRQANINLSKNVLLQEADITNCKGLGLTLEGTYNDYTIDLSNNRQLATLKAKGCTATYFDFADSNKLRSVELPSVKGLTLVNQNNINYGTTFTCESLAELKSIHIEDCKSFGLSFLKTCVAASDALTDVYMSVDESYTGNDSLNIASYLRTLKDHVANVDLRGRLFLENAYQVVLDDIKSLYPNMQIDAETILAPAGFTISVSGAYTVYEGKTAQYTGVSSNADYQGVKWSVSDYGDLKGKISINNDGLLTVGKAVDNTSGYSYIKIRATSIYNPLIYKDNSVTVRKVAVTSAVIVGKKALFKNREYQYSINISPSDNTKEPSFKFLLEDSTYATITEDGLLKTRDISDENVMLTIHATDDIYGEVTFDAILNEGFLFTTEDNFELTEALYNYGLCASPFGVTKTECEEINNSQLSKALSVKKDIVHFDELQYFTMIDRFENTFNPTSGYFKQLESLIFPASTIELNKTFYNCNFSCTFDYMMQNIVPGHFLGFSGSVFSGCSFMETELDLTKYGVLNRFSSNVFCATKVI